jgi:hypothetical protein
MALWLIAPAAMISSMIGRTLAANRRAFAFTAFGSQSVVPPGPFPGDGCRASDTSSADWTARQRITRLLGLKKIPQQAQTQCRVAAARAATAWPFSASRMLS